MTGCCARCVPGTLPPTLPEREGWVDREALYGFEGRNRKPQMALAERFGFTDWAQPAGGCCFLTDEQYSRKLADLWDSRGSREYELDDIMLLKVGRHIRPAPHFKLIVGREEGENAYLEGYRRQFIALRPTSHKGPLCLIDGRPEGGDVQLAARVLARYSQGRDASSVTVVADEPGGDRTELSVAPMPPAEIPAAWHV